jgi:hypothetical protein
MGPRLPGTSCAAIAFALFSFAPKGPNNSAQGNALVVTHKLAPTGMRLGAECIPGPS